MNQKQIGIIVLIIGLMLAGFVYVVKVREDNHINLLIKDQGSCFLPDGTCLHGDRDYMIYVFGWVISFGLVILGIYLIFFDKTQQVLAENQKKVVGALKDAKKVEKEKDEFKAFLSGFSQEEKSVLSAIHAQDGIKQSTLRYKTGISKSSLSLLLKSLEERRLITRNKSGKTNEVYLKKMF